MTADGGHQLFVGQELVGAALAANGLNPLRG